MFNPFSQTAESLHRGGNSGYGIRSTAMMNSKKVSPTKSNIGMLPVGDCGVGVFAILYVNPLTKPH